MRQEPAERHTSNHSSTPESRGRRGILHEATQRQDLSAASETHEPADGLLLPSPGLEILLLTPHTPLQNGASRAERQIWRLPPIAYYWRVTVILKGRVWMEGGGVKAWRWNVTEWTMLSCL